MTNERMQKRLNDRRFLSLARLWEAVRHDPTGNMELAVAALGFMLNGALILSRETHFPPPDVEFLLSAWLVDERRLGLILFGFGSAQLLSMMTRSHALRAWIALFNSVIAAVITTAYLFADRAAYYQVWVAYFGMAVLNFFLCLRNFRAEVAVEDAKEVVKRVIEKRRENGT